MFRYLRAYKAKVFSSIGICAKRAHVSALKLLCNTWNFIIEMEIFFRYLVLWIRGERPKFRVVSWLLMLFAVALIFDLVIDWVYIDDRLSSFNTRELIDIAIAISLILVTSVYTFYTKRLADLQRASISHLHEINTLQYCPNMIVSNTKAILLEEELVIIAYLKNVGAQDAINVTTQIVSYPRYIAMSEKALITGPSKDNVVPHDGIEIANHCPLETVRKIYEGEASAAGIGSFCTITIRYIDSIGNNYSHILDISLYLPSLRLEVPPVARLDRYRFRKSPPSTRTSIHRKVYNLPAVEIETNTMFYYEYQHFIIRKSMEKYKCADINQ